MVVMVGFGEIDVEFEEIIVMICEVGVEVLVVGQYLQLMKEYLVVDWFVILECFDEICEFVLVQGYCYCVVGLFVWSSYYVYEYVD